MNRIPTLDGWRGIAILLVIIAHVQAGLSRHHTPFHGYLWLILGTHGVAIFFVLSGYLITSKLFEEEKIDLKGFYVRRFFRLMPVAWTYLLCVALLGWILKARIIGAIDIVPCLLFFRNYYPTHEATSWALTSHFWSLSVEEQFYLVWPVLLAFAGRWRALVLALSLITVSCIYGVFSGSTTLWPQVALLVGCILAFAMRNAGIRRWIQLNHMWIFLICLVGFGWHITRYHYAIPFSETLLIAFMLACTSLSPSMVFSRILEHKFLKGLGIYSYSLYVWQELFLITHIGLVFMMLLPIVAIASWTWIEQPWIRIGRRMWAVQHLSSQKEPSTAIVSVSV